MPNNANRNRLESQQESDPNSRAFKANVRWYFQNRAADYDDRSRRLPWRILRAREAGRVKSLLGDMTGEDVLEFGCGAGYYTRLLLELGARHVWAVDQSAEMLAQLPLSNVTPVEKDVVDFSIERKFDRAFSAGLLEFVPSPPDVLANLAKHVRPGGTMTILFPVRNFAGMLYKRYHLNHGIPIHLFSREDMAGMAGRANWEFGKSKRCGLFALVANLHRVE